jgi:ADP-glucose pyrophosphorylase
VRRNLDFVLQQDEEHVLILAGDHIYLMDYQPMLREHIQSAADLTVAVRRVNPHETHRYGIVTLGADDRIVEFRRSRAARARRWRRWASTSSAKSCWPRRCRRTTIWTSARMCCRR